MKSYTTLRNLYGKYTQNSTTANLSQGDEYLNDGYRQILGMRDWPFLYKKDTSMTTTASTQFKEMPTNVGRVNVVTVTVSSKIYTPKLIESERDWQRINLTTYTSDIPEFAFVRGGQLGLFPTPATSSNTITLYHKQLVKDLSIADYAAGGILTTTGTTAVVGTGTVWTTSMAGRYLRITESDTALKGDGYWYEISSVASATSLTLVKPYTGTNITAGNAAYTIGQMPILPETYHPLLPFYAAGEYWDSKTSAAVRTRVITRSGKYQEKYQALLAQMIREYSNRTTDPVIDSGDRYSVANPNLFVSL